MMTAVDDLLEKYSLTRDNAAAYIDAIVRMNQSETAEAVGLTRQTVNRYKKAFAAMSDEERAFLVACLFDERWRAVSRRTD
jgi:DNA-binding XRE family transcriptional regulator